MKAQLKEITTEMTNGNEELANIINLNFETINEHQHNREIAIFGRYNELNNKLDGIKTLMGTVQDDIINRFNNSDERINSIDTKLDRILKWIDGQSGSDNLLT